MTDEQMDARLRSAGERWRTAHTAAAAIDPIQLAEPTAEIAAPRAPKRHWPLLASAAVVAAALVTGGALVLNGMQDGRTPSGDTAALEGHVWQLADSQGRTTFFVDRDGNLVADDDCRLIGGTVALDGDSMTVTKQVVRHKSCVDQYGAAYYDKGTAVLDGTSSVQITTDAMTLSKDGDSLHFVLAPDGTPAPTLDFPTVTGTPWQLVSAKDADGNDVTVAGDPSLQVGDDGTMSAGDGCNHLTGSAAVDATGLTFSNVGGTEIGCTGDQAATATVVDAMFTGRVQAIALGGELTLTKDKSVLVFRWNPDGSDANDPAALADETWTLADPSGYDVPTGTVLDTSGWTVDRGTLHAAAGATKLAELLGTGSHPWTIRNGRLVIFVDDTQASTLVFTSGTVAPPPSDDPLLGTTWHVTSITFGDGRYRSGAPPAIPASLTLSDGGFRIDHSPCYAVEGDLAHTDTTLSFTGGTSVDVGSCPFVAGESVTQQAVDAVLSGSTSWAISNGKLTITKGTGSLVFAPQSDDVSSTPLSGTDWELETAVASSGAEYPADAQSLRVQDGQLSASDGVNTIGGPVTVSDDTLTFGDLASTAIGSTTQDPVTGVIDDLLATGEVGYRIQADALVLSRGNEQLIYRAHKGSDSASDSIVGSWTLTTIENGTTPDGTASSVPANITMDISANGAFVFSGLATPATLSDGTIDFSNGWSSGLDAGLDATDRDFVFRQVLHGKCTYAIDGDQLTITHDGVGAVVLTRS